MDIKANPYILKTQPSIYLNVSRMLKDDFRLICKARIIGTE